MAAPTAMRLVRVEELLTKWLKPKINAEAWDNVGLLIGSGRFEKEDKEISTLLLCNDLTLDVVDEAIQKKVDLIIAYHPPIFAALKSVGFNSIKERILTRCIAHDICVYSPHTALDSVHGGINDLVAFKMGGPFVAPRPIIPRLGIPKKMEGIEVLCTPDECRELVDVLNKNDDVLYGFAFHEPPEQFVVGPAVGVGKILVRIFHSLPIAQLPFAGATIRPEYLERAVEALPYYPGAGRVFGLSAPLSVNDFVGITKKIFNIDRIQIAFGDKRHVSTVAFCAGSGGSIMDDVTKADIVLTGEMGHHDVLDCKARGMSVVLLGHCNSERPYLTTLQKILKILLNLPSILISDKDISPLKVM